MILICNWDMKFELRGREGKTTLKKINRRENPIVWVGGIEIYNHRKDHLQSPEKLSLNLSQRQKLLEKTSRNPCKGVMTKP